MLLFVVVVFKGPWKSSLYYSNFSMRAAKAKTIILL